MSNHKSLKYLCLGLTFLISPYVVANSATISLAPQQMNKDPALSNEIAAPLFHGDSQGNLPFSEAVQVGNTLYLAGQIGIRDGKLIEGGTAAETRQALTNIFATLQRYGYQPSDVIKCTVMLKDMRDFNDFNREYRTLFKPPYPARSTFGVSDLAMGANVEVECIAAR